MEDPLDFTGKVALVTGSSRGIGAEMIKAFDNRGATCVVNYFADPQGQNKADAANVARELKDPLMIDCDVTQPAQVEQMMKQIQDRHGGLDILMNNSGIIRDRTIKKMSLEEFESIIRVNLTGTFNVTQKAMPILRNGGRIVNLSSVSGQVGLFGQANYSSSKAAIVALRIMRMFSSLPKTTEAQTLGKQVLRSGTAAGANYREAYRGRSKAEFISKCGDSLRELEETGYWLELLVDGKIVEPTKLSALR